MNDCTLLFLSPCPLGCHLAGAGGGGFLAIIAKEEGYEKKLQRIIETVPVSLTSSQLQGVHTGQPNDFKVVSNCSYNKLTHVETDLAHSTY